MQRIPEELFMPNGGQYMHHYLAQGISYICFYGEDFFFGHPVYDKRDIEVAIQVAKSRIHKEFRFKIYYPSHVLYSKL